jgi:hypothetical protein
VFIPKVNTNTIGPVTKEQLKGPEPGWSAVIIERDTIGHTGTHLLKVSRRYFGSLRDEQPIILYAEWKKWIERHKHYASEMPSPSALLQNQETCGRMTKESKRFSR